ncbi:MAG: PAC2 family protein [Actinomycetaceae bacterium]|nr:PAC2 family protein [Actinomycetaceae bacterium]
MHPSELLEIDTNVNYHAPILLCHLYGATDAGNAGGLAVEQLLASLPSQRVATFDTDMLIDYRSHRPILTVENWTVVDMETPEIALDLVHDDAGLPILILHGPEPDTKWQRFSHAVADFAQAAGVEVCVSLKGMPATIPHTRPTLVHVQSTDRELTQGQTDMGEDLRLPASANTFLHFWLASQGIDGITFLAAVPFYMSGMDYPQATLALLNRMGSTLELSLPMGNIVAGTQAMDRSLEESVENNEELATLVEGLEQHFDERIEALKSAGNADPTQSGESFARDFAQIARGEDGASAKFGDTNIDTDALAATIERYLARAEDILDEDGEGPSGQTVVRPDAANSAGPAKHRARHRKPRPWEVAEQAPQLPDNRDGASGGEDEDKPNHGQTQP